MPDHPKKPSPIQQEATDMFETAEEAPSKRNTDSIAPPGDHTMAHVPEEEIEAGDGRPSLSGQTFGDFEILEEIGRGGMGTVYKARQKSLDRVVALKVLLAQHFENTVSLARFLKEARTAASLAHPNIVQVYMIEEARPCPYFVMEFVDGQSLEALTKGQPIAVGGAVNVMVPVAEAVHYAHSRGVIHRDLKPANIMVDRFRRPVVMDFGIAKSLGKSSTLTKEGAIVGTPGYMSPEQAGEEVAKIGPRTDVYSLGAVLYTLLTGKAPFDEGTVLRTLMKVVSSDPPVAVRELRPEVPEALEEICMRSLSKSVDERQESAHALAEQLRRFKATVGKKTVNIKANPKPAQISVSLIARSNGKEIKLSHGITVVGRSNDCKLALKASDVSKRHCQINVSEKEMLVEDLGSVNGTFVNGERIESSPVEDGDELTIASHVFAVRLKKPGQTVVS